MRGRQWWATSWHIGSEHVIESVAYRIIASFVMWLSWLATTSSTLLFTALITLYVTASHQGDGKETRGHNNKDASKYLNKFD